MTCPSYEYDIRKYTFQGIRFNFEGNDKLEGKLTQYSYDINV